MDANTHATEHLNSLDPFTSIPPYRGEGGRG